MTGLQRSSEPIDLRLGDCLAPEGLPSLANGTVDVLITDGPFDARAHRTAVEVGDWHDGERQIAGALKFHPLSRETIGDLGRHFARITRRWILVFCGERQIETWATSLETAGARFVRLGWADRTNPRPMMLGDRPAVGADPIVIAHSAVEGRMRWNGGGRPGRWPAPAARHDPGGQIHETQKSLRLMRALVEDFTDPGELVCDPFAGGGTTAVACKEAGRRFLGWELDPGYHGAAVRRIARAREQLQLARSTAPPPEQRALALPLDAGEGE